jgi:hypothetical protein
LGLQHYGYIGMWQFLALMLTVVGSVFIYLTNKNQTVISSPMAKSWRLLGYILCVFALFMWLQIYVISAAIFTWIFTLNVALVCIPLLGLSPIFTQHKGELNG